MDLCLPQGYVSKIVRAVVEFRLIAPGDRILIGLSGGKDSLLLTYAMALLRRRLRVPFDLAAFTLDPQFSTDFNPAPLREFCAQLDIPYSTESTDIRGVIAAQGEGKPCHTCAYFRRAAINRHARALGCNKVAYAHHLDDAIETLIMSLFCSGQLRTFTPRTYLTRTGLTVIRPLVYLSEAESTAATAYHGQTPLPPLCPYSAHTARADIKALLGRLYAGNPLLRRHLAAALRRSSLGPLWEPPRSRAEMRRDYHDFFDIPAE